MRPDAMCRWRLGPWLVGELPGWDPVLFLEVQGASRAVASRLPQNGWRFVELQSRNGWEGPCEGHQNAKG